MCRDEFRVFSDAIDASGAVYCASASTIVTYDPAHGIRTPLAGRRTRCELMYFGRYCGFTVKRYTLNGG
jgi:hypothetical protein